MEMRVQDNGIVGLVGALDDSEAFVVGAGAGLSTSAGFTYTAERFERLFGDFIAKYGLADMHTAGFFPYPTTRPTTTTRS